MEKISIFSLSTSKPQLMMAVLSEDALVVNEVRPLAVSAREQKLKIPAAIQKLRDSGYKVLVDEVTPTISAGTGASQVTLKTRFKDGRAAVIVGMERYKELKLKRLLSLPKESRGLFEIPDSIVDTEYNGNGEEVYRVNWVDIHALTRLQSSSWQLSIARAMQKAANQIAFGDDKRKTTRHFGKEDEKEFARNRNAKTNITAAIFIFRNFTRKEVYEWVLIIVLNQVIHQRQRFAVIAFGRNTPQQRNGRYKLPGCLVASRALVKSIDIEFQMLNAYKTFKWDAQLRM